MLVCAGYQFVQQRRQGVDIGPCALLAMLGTAAVNVRLDRDFAREWRESLRVKQWEPPGETVPATG